MVIKTKVNLYSVKYLMKSEKNVENLTNAFPNIDYIVNFYLIEDSVLLVY